MLEQVQHEAVKLIKFLEDLSREERLKRLGFFEL